MKRLVLLLFLALIAVNTYAADVTSGTVTDVDRQSGDYTRISVDWLSDASGNVVATLDAPTLGDIKRITIASDSGATSPTTAYDITLLDALGVDVLQGGGADVASATDKDIVPVIVATDSSTTFPVTVFSPLLLKITNAGNAKGGNLDIILKK
jgi:hypothetical protein